MLRSREQPAITSPAAATSTIPSPAHDDPTATSTTAGPAATWHARITTERHSRCQRGSAGCDARESQCHAASQPDDASSAAGPSPTSEPPAATAAALRNPAGASTTPSSATGSGE